MTALADSVPEVDRFRGPWFDAKTAAAYVHCPTVRAWYEWRKRHRIVALRRGLVLKADIDKALRAKSKPRVMADASLANLQHRGAR
jgi:hypothetical protein